MSHITEITEKYITVEPVMDFQPERFIEGIMRCNPKQVNIGADSGNNRLPKPTKEKVMELITALEKVTVVKQKANLSRLLR
jgi:hypothetical protein